VTSDPQLPPPVSKTAPDAQHPDRLTLEEGRHLAEQLAARTAERDRLRQLLSIAERSARELLAELAHENRTRAEHPATFTIRPAGEDDNVTVALRNLGPCPICGHDIRAGFFAVAVDDGPPSPKAWVHESCTRPGRPPRPPLNADPTRNRT
jgi:hypothetical protein